MVEINELQIGSFVITRYDDQRALFALGNLASQ